MYLYFTQLRVNDVTYLGQFSKTQGKGTKTQNMVLWEFSR